MVSSIFASCAKCGGIDFKDEMIWLYNNEYHDECILKVNNE